MRSVENAEKQCRKTMLTNFKKKAMHYCMHRGWDGNRGWVIGDGNICAVH